MKNNSKRICALLLAIVMCVTCVVPVFAESTPHVHADVVCPGADETHTMTNAPVKFVKTVAPKCGTFGYDLYECETCKTPVVTNWTEVGDGKDAWGEWTVVTKPTCTAYGVMERVCTNAGCGNKETINASNFAEKTALYGADVTKAIKPLDHKNADGTSAIKNDRQSGLECKEGIPAYKEWCELCDYTNNVPETPGQPCDRYVAEIVSQPNCYEAGRAIVKCKNCSYEAEEVIVNATGSLAHTWDTTKTVVTTAPTCGTAGSGTIYCGVCKTTVNVVANKVNFTYVTASGVTTPVEIVLDASFGFAATGVHSFTVDVTGSPADCDDKGVKDHKKCANCDAVSLDGTTVATAADLEIAPLGHTWTDVAGVAHTCEKDGVKAHFECSVCHKLTFDKTADPVVYITAADVVDAAAHDYDLTIPVAKRDPSCTLYGFWFYGCGVCGTPAESNGSNAGETPVPTEAVKAAYGDEVTAEWVSNGVLRISKLPHDCTETTTTGDCVTATVVHRECNDCDFEEDVAGTIPGHTWTTVTYAQNCKFDGYKFDYCSVCGFVAGANTDDGIAIDECVTVRIQTTAAEAGSLKVTDATGKYDVVAADPNNHKWDEVKTNVTTPATCTTMGKAVKFCVLCSDYYNVDLPALGHNNEAYVSEEAPKCGVDGYYIYECSRCGVDSTQVNIKAHEMAENHPDYATKYHATKHVALKHTFVTKADVLKTDLPTNYIFVHDETDPRYATPVPTDADCTTPGYDTYKCVNPGCTETHTFSKKADGTHIYPALDHKEAGVSKYETITVLPNCKPADTDNDGVVELVGVDGKKYEKCALCGDEKNEVAIVFNWQNPDHHRDPADPSKVAGVYADTKWHNGVEYPTAAEADAAAGGTANGIMRIGSCDVSEIVEYYCDVCKYTFHVIDDSMVGNHIVKAGTDVALDPADCLAAGKYQHYECETCNKKVYVNADGKHVVYEDASVLVIPALGHDFTAGITAEDPADCTTAGVKAYYECARCHNKYLTNETNNTANKTDAELVIDALGHKWGAKGGAVAPSCGVAGVLAHYECERCDAVSLDGANACAASAIVDLALTHSWVHSTAVTVTCVTPGYQYHYCALCGDEYVDNYVYALGHVFTDVAKADETCAVAGKAAHVKCTACGELFAEGTTDVLSTAYVTDASLVISATGKHVYADGTLINNTCAPGVDFADSATCHTCGGTVAITHTALESNEVDATCTEYGYTVTYCKDCGYEKVEKKADFAPTGHNYQWIVTTPAQMYVGGEESYKCVAGNGSAGCGHVKETRPTDPTGGIEFSYEIDNAIVSGAEYVNGGKIKLTIKYKAANIDVSNIALRLNYDADLLTFVSGDFKCDAKDGEALVFAANNASIGGKTAGFVIVKAATTGFGEAPANKKLNGEGVLAEIYFNINKDVAAGSSIGFDVATTGDLASGVKQIKDGAATDVSANFGSVAAISTKALADMDIDSVYTSADEVEFLLVAFGGTYVAAADINQDGLIGSDDYALLNDLLIGNITYEEMCAAAQSK